MHEQEIKRLQQEFEGVRQKLKMQIDNLREKNNSLELQLQHQEIESQTAIKELEDRLSEEENALTLQLEKNQDLDS